MSDVAETEVIAGSVGEAKLRAVRKLRAMHPGLADEDVEFEIVEATGKADEVKVVARIDLEDVRERSSEFQIDDDPVERVREVLTRVVSALELKAAVSVEDREEGLWGAVDGSELGLLIGKRGQTIDAIQLLANSIAYRGSTERRRVTVDAAGYRERRAGALRRQADRAVSEALDLGYPVELAPMAAYERRIVHMHLADRADVETHSVGDEPDRCIVISPLR